MQHFNFTCPRSCPLVAETWCRFLPVLRRVGPTQVNSHTAKIQVDYSDPLILERAVKAMGGLWYGHGSYDLGDTTQVGFGFRLPMANGYHQDGGKNYWYHPLVALSEGELAFDAYGGQWGNVADLDRLKSEYALAACEAGAMAQGWQSERTAEGLVIHHPTGGSITVTVQGVVEAHGFHGSGCHDAIVALGLPLTDVQAKAEFNQVAAQVQAG